MAKNEGLAAKELRERGAPELRSLLAAKVEELHKERTKQALGQLRQTHVLRQLKREVARLQTVLAEQARSQA